MTRRAPVPAAHLLPVLLVPLLAACGDQGPASSSDTQVVVGFYPLQFVVERVGGDQVAVTNLTPPGAEPHDVELTPRDVARVSEADLVLALPGLQPALDSAAEAVAVGNVLEVTGAGRIDLAADDDVRAEAEAEEGHVEGDEHDHGAVDPHFWLDPVRLAEVADAVARRLGEIEPERADDFTAAAAGLRTDLEQLDADLAAGLENCRSRDLVTAHTAFGYLAERYDLNQIGIAGLSPGTEPTAGTLAEIATFVRDQGVTTVFTETLASPDTAEAVAAEAGAATAVLDPVEGLAEGTDADYLSVMRENLSVLQEGLGCS